MGCIYTAQGFDFDYIGVIVGNDLKYNASADSLDTEITATYDPEKRQEEFRYICS